MGHYLRSVGIPMLCALLLAGYLNLGETQDFDLSKDDVRPILGIVVPGKSTLPEFVDALKEKGCQCSEVLPEEGLKSEVVVPKSCFDLPGDPIISAGAEGRSEPISMVRLEWDNDEDGTLFNRYFLALEDFYGHPYDTETPHNFENSATWMLKPQRIYIHLTQPTSGKRDVLLYKMGESSEVAFEEFKKESKKTGKDLENL